jgi:hypothetical protein
MLRPVFMPALITLLAWAEREKGEYLTEDEVRSIRDNAVVMMLPYDKAEALAESRGHDDLNPEDCWHQWLTVRDEISRTNNDTGN